MKPYVDALVREALSDAIEAGLLRTRTMPEFRLDTPRYPAFGDLACDVALVLGRELAEPPPAVAAIVTGHIRDRRGWLAGIEVGGPGFVNFRFAPSFWRARLEDALAAGPAYGVTSSGRGRRVRVEIVHDDAGGEPSVRDGRAAAVAGAAARLLEAAGCDVERTGPVPRLGAAALPGSAGADTLDEVIEVVGAEHAAAVARRPSAAPRRLIPVHPVRLTRDGEPVRGDVTLGAILREVGRDAAQFLFLLERADRPLDLDLELAKLERTDNPVFHVQYAGARIAGVLRGVREDDEDADLSRLDDSDAEALRAVAAWPDVVELATRSVAPHRIATHAVELATVVHRWANRNRVVRENREPTRARLALARCLRHILCSALAMCGVSAPERM